MRDRTIFALLVMFVIVLVVTALYIQYINSVNFVPTDIIVDCPEPIKCEIISYNTILDERTFCKNVTADKYFINAVLNRSQQNMTVTDIQCSYGG